MPINVPNPKVYIPVQLIPQLFRNRLLPAFKVFLAIKMGTPGHFTAKKSMLDKLCLLSGFKKRTLIKHLARLTALGWLGHDEIKNTYYARSWAWFRQNNYFFYRASYLFSLEHLPNLQQHLFAAYVSSRVGNQQHQNISMSGIKPNSNLAKKMRTAVYKGGTAPQVLEPEMLDWKNGFPYCGFSNKGLARHFGISESRARQLKQEASGLGLLIAKDHYLIIGNFEENQNLVDAYKKAHPDEKGVKIKIVFLEKGKCYQLMRQLHTEIIPQIKLYRMNYLKKIRQKYAKMTIKKPVFTQSKPGLFVEHTSALLIA